MANNYKALFEGRFTETHSHGKTILEKIYYYISPSTYNERSLFAHVYKYAMGMSDSATMKILDIGCGGGHRQLNNMGDVYGVDVSEESVKNAQEIYKYAQVIDVTKGLPFEDKSFDLAFSSEVFGHIAMEDKNLLLKELQRVLKPNAGVVFSVETDGCNILTSFLRRKNLYQTYWIDYHGHIGLEKPSDTVKRFSYFFKVNDAKITCSHVLPLDGYMTFAKQYPILGILNNNFLRRCGNIIFSPIFFATLKLSSFDSGNDVVIFAQNSSSD